MLKNRVIPRGQIVKANGIDIWYETFGKKEDPAVLLIMGGCSQGILWHENFCKKLAKEGFYVIRYDHRDSGFSTCFDFKKETYGLMDMAKDAVGILEAVGVKKAHLFGLSMGSFIAELMAVHFSERVYSLLLMGSTCDIRPMNGQLNAQSRPFTAELSGYRGKELATHHRSGESPSFTKEFFNLTLAGLPPEKDALFSPPSPVYLAFMREFVKLSPETEEEKLAQRIEGWNMLNGNKVALDERANQEVHQEFLSRLRHPEGMVNHITMLRQESSERLVQETPSRIRVPTTILQGSEDPIYAPDHGEALHRLIKNSEYCLVQGMGHVPNDHFYDLYIGRIKLQKIKPEGFGL